MKKTTSDDTKFQLARDNATKSEEFTLAELIKIKDDSVAVLNSIKSTVDNILNIIASGAPPDEKLIYPYMWSYAYSLRRYGHIEVTERPVYVKNRDYHTGQDVFRVDDGNIKTICKIVDDLIEDAEAFIKSAKRGKIPKTAYLPVVKPASASKRQTYYTPMYNIGIIDIQRYTSCEKCGAKMTLGKLEPHQNTQTCMMNAARKDSRDDDLVRVRPSTMAHHLARRNGIPGARLIPIKYEVHVPKWALSAIEMYSKHGPKGYAGMTIDEFIARMAEDRQSQTNSNN